MMDGSAGFSSSPPFILSLSLSLRHTCSLFSGFSIIINPRTRAFEQSSISQLLGHRVWVRNKRKTTDWGPKLGVDKTTHSTRLQNRKHRTFLPSEYNWWILDCSSSLWNHVEKQKRERERKDSLKCQHNGYSVGQASLAVVGKWKNGGSADGRKETEEKGEWKG